LWSFARFAVSGDVPRGARLCYLIEVWDREGN
jgi:hypothetical protein